MKNKKGFVWLPILLAILGLLVVGSGAYYFMHQNATPQAPQKSSELPTITQQEVSSQQNTKTGQNATAKNSVALTAVPTSGTAPLAVTFSGTISISNPSSTGGLGVDEPWIDFGDEQEGDAPSYGGVFCPTPSDVTNYVYPTSCAFSPVSHTYQLPGTYTAVLHLGVQKGTDITLGTSTIVVTGSGPAFQKSLIIPDGLTATPSSGIWGQPITFSTSFGGQNMETAYYVDFGNNKMEWFLCGQTLSGALAGDAGQANESCLPPTFQYTYTGAGPATYTVTLHKYTGDFNNAPAVGTAIVKVAGN